SAPGWARDESPHGTLRAGGVRVRVAPLARREGVRALACEAGLGEPFPTYPQRRTLHARLRERLGPVLVLFTDAAHCERVWCWETAGGGSQPVYREHRCSATEPESARLEALRRAARDLVGPPPYP